MIRREPAVQCVRSEAKHDDRKPAGRAPGLIDHDPGEFRERGSSIVTTSAGEILTGPHMKWHVGDVNTIEHGGFQAPIHRDTPGMVAVAR